MSTITTIPSSYLPSQQCLTDKVIAVTGADSHLGYAIALGLAKQGAHTLLIAAKKKNMIRLYDEICHQNSPEPLLIEFNSRNTSAENFDNLTNSLAAIYPQLHGLIHAAHKGAPLQPIANSSMDTWQTVLQQELIQPMYLTRSLIPLLKHPDPAAIIFTNWHVGRRGRAYWGALGASYAAIENLSETLSDEISHYHIAVCSFDPGKLKTALRKQFYPDENATDLIAPNDSVITNAYLYLLTQPQNEINGKRFALVGV